MKHTHVHGTGKTPSWRLAVWRKAVTNSVGESTYQPMAALNGKQGRIYTALNLNTY